MGWKGPRTLDVTLPEELRAKAGGVHVVTCRYFGEGRQQRVKTRREVRQMERWEKMGKVISEAADAHAAKVKAGKVDKPDPEKMLLAVFPPDLVCCQVVRALDGEKLGDEKAREGWVDDAHSAVVRHVALEVMRESDVELETEDEQGEGSGGSSDTSSGPKPVPTKSERSRRRTATS